MRERERKTGIRITVIRAIKCQCDIVSLNQFINGGSKEIVFNYFTLAHNDIEEKVSHFYIKHRLVKINKRMYLHLRTAAQH